MQKSQLYRVSKCRTVTYPYRFDMEAMLDAIQAHKVNNIPGVPLVILGLVKHGKLGSRLASLRRVGSGAALSKESDLCIQGKVSLGAAEAELRSD